MEICINTIKQGRHTIIAACDAELLDKTLIFGKIKFDVRKDFYGGSRVFLDEAMEIIKMGTIINLVGEQIVTGAVKHGLVHPNAIIDIAGVPHVQIMRY
jgi:hypothetical protein